MTIEGRAKELKAETEVEAEKVDNSELEEMGGLRITKRKGIEDGEYSDIYKVTFPVSFYFDKEGEYDGLAFDTEDVTEEEAEILEELLHKLEEEL
jgi:hypothetical protein